jgi:hypothetical protein
MAKQRTIVGENLTPTLLRELGAVDRFPSTPADFKPDGNWTNKYRVWTCHGYRESGNQTVGSLQITRRANSAKIFHLKVRQEIDQTDELTNVVDATIKCRTDRLASPEEWKLSSRIFRADKKDISELSTTENGRMSGRAGRATGDWCLFEAVQRLAFDERTSLSFDLLEGMSLEKPEQHLSYRGTYPMKSTGKSIPLHCFSQLGSGILPCEYWLDDHHRLLAVISMNKAYILDK